MRDETDNNSTPAFRAIVGIVVVLVLLAVFAVWGGALKSAEEIRGRVLDGERPISGVAVVAIWELRGVEGTHVRNLAIRETVSDDDGQFRIPGWRPRINSSFLYAGLPENPPQIILFHRDYAPKMLSNNSAKTILGIFIRAGELQDSDYRLQRWSTESAGRVDLGQQVDARIRNILVSPKCEWRQIPALLVEMHHLGLATINAGGRSLMLDRIPERDCGSAETVLKERL